MPIQRAYSRRAFLQAGLALGGLGLLAGCSRLSMLTQPAAPPRRLGFLALTPEPYHEALFEGLRDLGYVEGENVVFERRYSDGHPEKHDQLSRELVQANVDVLISAGIGQSTTRATRTTPIVMVIPDAVEQGLARTLARPEGNVTGINVSTPQLAAKRLEILTAAFQSVKLVAVVEGGGQTNGQYRATLQAAQPLAVSLRYYDLLMYPNLFTAPANPDTDTGISQITVKAEGVVSLDAPFITYKRGEMIAFAAERRIPAIYPHRVFADDGGLMSYGPNYTAMYGRLASYVDKILKGANPGEIPMEQPTALDFVVNLKTAQALGLTIPRAVLEQATEVIQ